MNLFAAADEMIEVASRELSHCFAIGIPTTFAGGRKGEVLARFAKSKPVAVVAVEIDDELDTLHLEGAEDCPAGSQARLDLLRAYYEIEELKAEPRSASVITDSEFADDLIRAIVNFPLTAKATPMVEFICAELRKSHDSGELSDF